MTPEFVVGLARQAIQETLMISLPILGIGLVVGIAVSLFQAATQIQEMTLTFIPKIVGIFLGLLFLLPWIMNHLQDFTLEIFSHISRHPH